MATPFSYAKIMRKGVFCRNSNFIQKYYIRKRIKTSSWSLDIAAGGLNTAVFLR